MTAQHLSVPYQLDVTGSAVTVDQDSPAEVAQCVRVLLSTPVGTRVEEMDYGIPDPTFTDLRAAPALVSAAIGRWEPRAIGADITATAAGDGSATITASLPRSRS